MSKFAVSKKERTSEDVVYMEVVRTPSIEAIFVAPIEIENTCMDPIRNYLEKRDLLNEPNEAKKLMSRAAKYTLID